MPHFIVDDRNLLAACVAIAALDGGLIVFDGRPNSGRTRLARDMAHELNGTCVEAGDDLERDGGIDALRRALDGAARPVLLSSVCARQVVERLGVAVSIVVWVEQESIDEGDEREAYSAAYDARGRPDVVVYREARASLRLT